MKMNLFLLLFLLSTSFANHHQVTSFSNATDQFDAFYDSMKRIVAASNDRFEDLAREIRIISSQLNNSGSFCYRSLAQIFESGYQAEWSAKMLHSTSILQLPPPITSSLLAESLSSLGDFDQCLSAEKYLHFRSKYCLVHLLTPALSYELPVPLPPDGENSYLLKLAHRWAVTRNRLTMLAGLCLPSVCSSKQVQRLLEKYFAYYLKSGNGIRLKVGHCQLGGKFPLSASNVVSSVDLPFSLAKWFLLSLLLTSIFSTLILSTGLISAKSWPLVRQLLICFHAGRNLRELFVLRRPQVVPKYDLRFMHGARFLLTIFTVSAHSFTAIPISFFSRVSHFAKFPSFFEESEASYGLLDGMADRGGLSMDFFFLFSGFLTAYLCLSQRGKSGVGKGPPSLFLFAGLRWIRLAPSFAAFTALSIIAQKSWVSGPLAHRDLTEPHVRGCRSWAWWWGQLLLPVNNWWKMEDSCGPHLWFVAVDYQLHLLFYPVFLLLFWRRMRSAYCVILGLIALSIGGLLCIALSGAAEVAHFGFTHKFDKEIPFTNIRLMYTTPLIRVLPYFSGVLVAVYLLESPEVVPRKRKNQETLFWVNLVLILLAIFAPTPSLISNGPPLFRTLYYLFLQASHSLCIAIFLVVFLLTRGSTFRRLFYHPAMVPFSRLSYGMYLLNPLIIWTHYASVRTPVVLAGAGRQTAFMVVIYFYSFLAAMLLYVLVEAPFTALSKVIISASGGDKQGKEEFNKQV